MKKIALILLAAAITLGLASCASTATQETINTSFKRAYTSYKQYLNLEGAQSYTVQQGDTLTAITKSFYGSDNGYFFPIIMLASTTEDIQDPDFIYPGMELIIPDFDKNIYDSEVATSLKPYFKDIAAIYKKKGTETAPSTYKALAQIADELGTLTKPASAE